MERPLEGVKVVELTIAVAGPSAGATLADYGADVIKVEPPSGDTQRWIVAGLGMAAEDPCECSAPSGSQLLQEGRPILPRQEAHQTRRPLPRRGHCRLADRYYCRRLPALRVPDIESPHFYQINRGKRSVCLDLKSEEGKSALEVLLAEADVFLSNMRYGSLKSLGLGAEELLERHPQLIVCPMTGWGMEGPEADKPVYDVAGFWARSSAASSHTPRGE